MRPRPTNRLLGMLGLLAAALALQPGCDGQGEAQAEPAGGEVRGRLSISGSSTVAPLVADIARRFERAHPGARVDVQSGGSARGLADVRRGLADIAMVSQALEGDDDLHAHPIARDGVGLIVHAGSPVRALTTPQVQAIYRGEVTDWSALGYPPGRIAAVHKAEGRATLAVFLRHYDLRSREVRPTVVIGDNQHGIKTVAGDPGALGYVSIGSAQVESASGTPIRLLAVDGVEPTLEAVADGRFPMARPLLLVTREAPSGLARAFTAYARSPDVRDAVEEHAFAPHIDR